MASARPATTPDSPATRFTGTPGLDQHRVEVPTLDEQLADYEARQALLVDAIEDVDPVTEQRVYLVVAIVVGVVAALMLGGAGIAALVLIS